MYRIIPILFALFCANIALSGEFAEKYQPIVASNEKSARNLPQKPGREQVIKALFAGILYAMNVELEAKQKIGQAYTMDDEDRALYQKVSSLAQ